MQDLFEIVKDIPSAFLENDLEEAKVSRTGLYASGITGRITYTFRQRDSSRTGPETYGEFPTICALCVSHDTYEGQGLNPLPYLGHT